MAGEWKDQVDEIISEYYSRLEFINVSPLPLIKKLEAVRAIALAKVQHLLSNVHVPRKSLRDLTDKTVYFVRQWTGLNTHTTRNIICHNKSEGGLGVPDIEWTYIATRLSHLVNMLNNDDKYVRELARASLFLDLKRRKVPPWHVGRSLISWALRGNPVGNWTAALLASVCGQTGPRFERSLLLGRCYPGVDGV